MSSPPGSPKPEPLCRVDKNMLSPALKVKAVRSSDILVTSHHTTPCHNPEGHNASIQGIWFESMPLGTKW